MGIFYALKGIYHEDEVQELDKKFEVKDVITYTVPELVGERHFNCFTIKHTFLRLFCLIIFLKV